MSSLAKLATRLVLRGVVGDDVVVEPHVSDRHPVLSQRSGLVGANGRRGSQCFDRLQILDQAILLGHSLGSQRQTDLNRSKQTAANEISGCVRLLPVRPHCR